VEGRVEMHLVSRCDQRAIIGNAEFFFARGESIRTEFSYKYSLNGLRDLAKEAGFIIRQIWMDEREYFGVLYLTVAENHRCRSTTPS
jgi:uncharacterized SAM-dependent methyltransferase